MIDNILGINKPAGSREYLCYNETSSNISTSSKTTFVLASIETKNLEVNESIRKDILEQRSSMQHRDTSPKNPKLKI